MDDARRRQADLIGNLLKSVESREAFDAGYPPMLVTDRHTLEMRRTTRDDVDIWDRIGLRLLELIYELKSIRK